MGACASRPRDLDGQAPEAIPADVPAPSSAADAVDAVETTEITVVEENINEINGEEMIETEEEPISVVEVSEELKAEDFAPATTSGAGEEEEKAIEESKAKAEDEQEEETKSVLSEEQPMKEISL